MTGDYNALLRGVLIDPADDLPRLVLADWLDDNGHGDRAEFVRLQIGLFDCVRNGIADTEAIAGQVRCCRLLCRHADWLPLLDLDPSDGRGDRRHGELSRGFVSEIRLPLAAFFSHAEELFAAHPIERVVLTDRAAEAYIGDRNSQPRFTFWRVDFPNYNFLNPNLFDLIVGGYRRKGTNWKEYASQAAANADLSAACVAYGRELAGLPELAARA